MSFSVIQTLIYLLICTNIINYPYYKTKNIIFDKIKIYKLNYTYT